MLGINSTAICNTLSPCDCCCHRTCMIRQMLVSTYFVCLLSNPPVLHHDLIITSIYFSSMLWRKFSLFVHPFPYTFLAVLGLPTSYCLPSLNFLKLLELVLF